MEQRGDHKCSKWLITQLRHSSTLAVHMERPAAWFGFEKVQELLAKVDDECVIQCMQGSRFAWIGQTFVAAVNGHSIVGVYGPGGFITAENVPDELSHGTDEQIAAKILKTGLWGVIRPIHFREDHRPRRKEAYAHSDRVRV